MKFPSFFQFGPCHFMAFMSASRVLVVNTYRFHLGVDVHESYPINEGAVCISEKAFNEARNEALSQMFLVDQNALFLAQIEAYEAEQEIQLLS
jgi:hypothetical protein